MKSILRFSFIVAISLIGFKAYSQFEIVSTSSTPVDCRPENGLSTNGTITITLSGGAPLYTITWQHLLDGTGGIVTTPNTEFTITGLRPGSYIITANYPGGDPDDPELRVRSVGQPSLLTGNITPNPVETCPGTELQLNGNPTGGNTGGYTHLWTGNATEHFLDLPTIVNPRFQANTPNTYDLNYTVEDSKGCIATELVDLVIYHQPVANAGSDDEACGLEYTLNAIPSVGSGIWTSSGPGSAVFNDNTDPNSLVTVDGFGTYTFTWTETNIICSDDDNISIGFFKAPTADAGGPYEVCAGSAVQLNGSIGLPALTAEWIGGLGNFTPNRNTLNAFYTPHASEDGTTVNLLLRTDDPLGACPPAEASTTITVYEQPVANAGSDGNSCSYNFTLAANASVGTGTWSKSSGTGNAIFSNLNSPTSGVTVDAYDTYVFTWTEVNGICSDADDVTVNFYEQPIANAGPDDQTCGLTLTLDATASIGLGTWTRESGPGAANFTNKNSPTSNVTVTAYGQYVFRWTEVNGTCSNFDEVVVDFFEQPIANAGANGNSCSYSYTLDATASTGTGTWTKSSGIGNAIFSNLNSPTSGVTVDAYDTYVFTWTEVNGICSDADDVTVNFYEQPIANAGSDDQTCGLTLTLDATASIGLGTWTRESGPGAANFTNKNSPTSNVTVTAYGQYIFRWTEVNGTCSDFDELVVDFFEQPVADAGTGGSVCGTDFNLNAIPTVGTGTWTYTGPGTASFNPNANTHNATVTIDIYGDYTFTWTEVNGICNSNDDILVSFYEQPVANAGSDNETCGFSISLAAIPSVGTGTWTFSLGPGAANFDDLNEPTTGVTVTAYGTYQFTWTEVNGTCLPSADNVTIDFFEQPLADAGTDDQTCGLSIALNANPSVGTGTWTRTSGPGTANFTNQNSPTSSVTVTAYGKYVLRWTEVNGNCSDFNEVTIDFFEQPVADAGTDGNSCSYNYTLDATASVGTGTWTKSSGIGNAIFDNPNSPTSGVTVDTYDTYVFTWTEVNGICSDADNVTVNFYEQPVANAGTDDITCGQTIALNATASIGTGTWTQFSGSGTSIFTNENSPTSNVTVNAYGQYVYRWTEVNGVCSDFDDVIIDFYEQPVADAGTGGGVCGTDFNLSAIPTVGTGTWTYTGPGTASFSPNANTHNATVTADTYGDYTFTWTEVNGICNSTDDILVSFYEQPVADAGSDAENCSLTATLNAVPSAGLGTWTLFSGPAIATFVNANDPGTDVTVDLYGIYTFRWTEVNNICSDFADVTITFYETPTADAGADDNACGYQYTLNATASVGTGVWTYTGPGTATLDDDTDPATNVSVDLLGLYTFTWTETNDICVDADDVDINFYEIDVDVDITNALCFDQANGTITINASGGVGNYIYSIYDETGPYEVTNVFNVSSGSYFIWVIDDNGCVAEYPGNPVFVDEPEKINFDYTVNNIISCFGSNDGSILINGVTGGSGNYEYSILEPAVWGTNPVFENLPGGPFVDYYIRVKDDTGCIVTGNNGNPITLDQPSEITFVTSPTDVTGCWYNTNGSISITNVIGGTGIKWVSINDTDDWQQIFNPTTKRFFTNLGVGDHTVRVRDRNNGPKACEVTRIITLTGPPPIVISDISLIHNECFGGTNGKVTITASGGTGALNYTLLLEGNPYAGPQTSNVFDNLLAGDYTVVVMDVNGCLLEKDFTITSPDELTLDTEVVDISCSFSGSDGKIRAMSTGGNEPYTITLYMGGIEQDNITNVSSGDWVEFTDLADANDYEVIVRDANFPACSELGSGMLTVIVPDILEFNPAPPIVQNLDCNGVPTGSITIAGQGGTLPYTYTLYDDASALIGNPIIANETNPVEFTDLPAGTYTVSIDDANNCGPVDSAPITITEPDAIEIDSLSITITNISCFGANDGEISLTATGGTGDLYYTITQDGNPVAGFITQTNNGTFAPLEPGVYIIEITDDNNCGPVLSEELTVIEPNAIEVNTEISDALCHGDNGSFTALATEGTPPYIYTLEDVGNNIIDTQNGDVDEWVSFADIPAGDYTLYVDDANGCQTSTIITITEPDEVTVSIATAESPTCDPDGTSIAGIIITTAQGGSGAYIYTIYRNGNYLSDNTDGIFNNLAAGDYYVEVYDTNGCGPATTSTEMLVNPTTLEIDNVIVTDVNCYGQSTGELEVIYSGEVGIPQFTITSGDDDWQTSNIFTDLPAGNYTVRVKDDKFCIVTLEVTINQSPQLIITTVLTPPTTSIDSDGSIEVNITGGTPNYWYELYLWDQDTEIWSMVNSLDDTDLTSHTFINLGIGAYRIIVKDMFDCEAIKDVSLSQFTVLLTATNVLCHDDCSGTITLNALGGVVDTLIWTFNGEDYSIEMEEQWDAGSGTYINLCAGLYSVLATDTDGVESNASIEITQPDPITVTYTITVPDCYTNLPEGIVEFDIQGGTTFTYGYDITWDSGSAQGFIADELAEGTYTFTITDQNGCEFTVDNVVVEYPEGMIMESFFAYNLLCNNNNSGEIAMLVSGGTEPITYTIDGPNGIEQNTDGIFNGLPAGEYALSIVDNNGCAFIFEGEYSETVTLTEPDAIAITAKLPIDTLKCYNDILDIVEMLVTGGTPEYTYSWDNGQEGLNLIEVGPGNYTLTVTDENNCVASETIVVPGPDSLKISATVTKAKCRLAPQGNDGEISIDTITGGNGVFDIDFNVKWYKTGFGHLENSDGLWAIDELQSGNYYALITDQKGCEENKPFNVAYNPDNDFQVGIEMDSTTYCWGDKANLEAIPIQGAFGSPAIFEWYNLTQDENLQIGADKSYTTPPLEADQIMLLKVISSQGCLEQRRDTIQVYPQIGPYLIRDDHPFFSDSDLIAFRIDNDPDSTVITVLADTEYPVEIRTKAADYTLAYAWDPSEFFSPANNKNSTVLFQTGQYETHETGTLENMITGKDEKYIPLTGSVKSEVGCTETIDLKARVLGKVRMSNVFSPNGDGINDIWFVPYADIFSNLEIKVFNRWGAEVWAAKASEATKGWNGKNKNGKDLPTGTYYYVISFNVSGSGKWKPISGSVTIVR